MTAAGSGPIDPQDVDPLWRAANYLAVGQLYLDDNALLARPLRPSDLKPRIVGHWGTVPGLNLVYAHLGRAVRERDLDAVFVTGPGHGGPALFAHTFLDGSLGETDPAKSRDEQGMLRLFREFSTPGGVPSHAAPDVPGSINEGGELGYSLAHAFGAVFDAPHSIAVCVIGDGEAETGPLAASWHSTSFLDPVRDGAVLPVLHLNGYKISGPTVPAGMTPEDLTSLLHGYGYDPVEVSGDRPSAVHASMASALDACLDRIAEIQTAARAGDDASERLRWPMIVLRTDKGWTGPRTVDGEPVEGTFRAHQVPLQVSRDEPDRIAQLHSWMESYRPDELFDAAGRPTDAVLRCVPRGEHRPGANPRANAGLVRRDLRLPETAEAAVDVPDPTARTHSPTAVLGPYLRDTVRLNPHTFRLFSPDELESNRLSAVFEATDRIWRSGPAHRDRPREPNSGPHGQVMEVLSEHLCEGWLEGYLLTGRHGMFISYEAFAHVVDSMVGQHAKWLAGAAALPWRHPPASLNILLTSHAWRQDHNGFTHQDPGFIDVVLNKDPALVRVLFPPDANSLLVAVDRALRSTGRINVIVAGKHPSPDYLTGPEAAAHHDRGVSVWGWAGTEDDHGPDVVLACAGETPTRETVAAARLLRRLAPQLRTRVVNVVDLLRLQDPEHDPRGLPEAEFDAAFTRDRPIVFAHHGYPGTVHRLACRRACHADLHVHGYRNRGTTTTPFDMLMENAMDRYTLADDALRRAAAAPDGFAAAREELRRDRDRAWEYTRRHGVDDPGLTADPLLPADGG